MTVKDIVDKLNLKVVSGENGLNNEIKGCYVSDLLSDVMGFADEGEIWITLQTHLNVMAIASLKELAAIILVKNIEPEEETIVKSNEENIPIIISEDQTFDVTGKLYNLLNYDKS